MLPNVHWHVWKKPDLTNAPKPLSFFAKPPEKKPTIKENEAPIQSEVVNIKEDEKKELKDTNINLLNNNLPNNADNTK